MTVPPPERAAHLRPSMLALVAAGGAVGTAAREGLALVAAPVVGMLVVILAINVVGAFVLGFLLEALLRRGADVGGRRLVRLAVGTGFCGGFTTYSAFAVLTAGLLRDGAASAAVLYAVLTVLLGAVATWAGLASGAGRRRP